MSSRWKIIFIATIFNLLFEYSLRGFNNIAVQPTLPFILFSIYFTLFIMLEDLIVRFKLKDYHLLPLAFFYGTFYDAYTSGIIYIKPNFLGIAIVPLLSINIAWWWVVQGLVTFYLANSIGGKRDWNHARLSKKGWILCLLINIFTVSLFQMSGVIPHGTPLGKFTTLVILVGSFLLSVASIKAHKPKIVPIQKSKFISVLSFLTLFVFLFCAIFLTGDPIRSNTSNVNATSLVLVSRYTFLLALLIMGYRAFSKKEISV